MEVNNVNKDEENGGNMERMQEEGGSKQSMMQVPPN